MTNQIQLSPQQREYNLMGLIKDAKELGFSKPLIQEYTRQLNEVRGFLRAEKDKMKFYTITGGRK